MEAFLEKGMVCVERELVDNLMLIILERKDTLSPLLMTIHIMVMYTYYMRNLRQWMP